jgi:hypothetical protein
MEQGERPNMIPAVSRPVATACESYFVQHGQKRHPATRYNMLPKPNTMTRTNIFYWGARYYVSCTRGYLLRAFEPISPSTIHVFDS